MPVQIIQSPENRNVYVKLDSITRDTVRGIRQAYYKLGKDLKKRASDKILEKPKSGKTYFFSRFRTSKSGKKTSSRISHVASAPGEYPANWTGKLRKSIGFEVSGSEKLIFGADTEYAKYLEEGTGKMAKRSYLLRTINEMQKEAVEHFETEIKKSLDRAASRNDRNSR